MSHKTETRRALARGRRTEDVKKYEKLLTAKVPQTLFGKEYKDSSTWKKVVERKLVIAKKDVESLNAVLEVS